MGFYQDKRDGVVHPMLSRYGTAMYLIVPGTGTYDPETGAFTPGSDASTKVLGLIGTFRKSRRGGETIQSKRRYVYIDPSGLSAVPMPGNRLKVNAVEHEIIDVETIEPGGVAVLYQLEVQLP